MTHGLDLLYRQGFAATGVQEIATASDVPKGSFYNYFSSKEDFAIQALGLYTEMTCAHLEQVLINGEGTPLARFRALFTGWSDELFEANQRRGCFAGNLSQELATQNPAFRKALARAFTAMQRYYTACLREAQAQDELDKRHDPEILAGFVYNAWQGALTRAKASDDARPLHEFYQVVFKKLLI